MFSVCTNYVAVVEVLLYFLSFFHFCDRLLKCKMNPKENSVMFLIHTMCYSNNSSQWSERILLLAMLKVRTLFLRQY